MKFAHWMRTPSVHQDDIAPKRPGCDNNFVLVKVPVWVDGKEIMEFVGVGARFGPTLESKEKRCKPNQSEVILVHRGNCSFVTKGNVAEAAGASALLIINNQTELFKMVCEANETDVNIHIPVVMLPQDAGASLKQLMMNGSHVSIQMYSPRRPQVDVAEVFLWLMAVGTILCAAYWSAWSAREAAIEQDKLLKDGSDEFLSKDAYPSSGVVDINTASAIFFVVIASCFLILLYKLMSYWGFIEISSGRVFALAVWRVLQNLSYVRSLKVEAVSYLTLFVSPFCIAFAVYGAVFRGVNFAWIGQEYLSWKRDCCKFVPFLYDYYLGAVFVSVAPFDNIGRERGGSSEASVGHEEPDETFDSCLGSSSPQKDRTTNARSPLLMGFGSDRANVKGLLSDLVNTYNTVFVRSLELN
ncbi:Signal peptide peptidase-like 2 [Sesamum alatum]|uniref:Signal peptide peptidase-like 2 n=1 Tax=Sesamum alatum TaxID=300844 RepID=A0AAE1XVY1_9LAMI|nr:Signal peptide peptidase-like 2 [Sesamum alatum]